MNFNPANLIWICPFCAAIGWVLHAFCAISGRQADHEEDESHARVRYAMQETIGERAKGYWHVTGDNPNVMLTKVGPRPEEVAAARAIAKNPVGYCDGVLCENCPFNPCSTGHSAEEWIATARAWLASHGLPVEETVPGTGPGEIERR